MGLFDLFKKRAKKQQRKTSILRYESRKNQTSLKNAYMEPDKEKERADDSFQTEIDEAIRSEEGYKDIKRNSTSISSESKNASKYKSAYENIKINQGQQVQSPDTIQPSRFCEKDNIGIRIRSMIEEDSQKLESGPFEKEVQQLPQPYIRYMFASGEDARDALLGLNFIHEAEDTGNLICIEPLTFGCYRQKNGKYEAYIGGQRLTQRLWKAAKESFAVHNGRVKNEQRPNAEFNSNIERGMTLSERVTKIREYSQLNSGQTEFYLIYDAPNSVIAQAFLKQKQNLVTKSDTYIIVKTPDGDFWRDISGIYKKNR